VKHVSHTIVNPDWLHDPVPFGYSHTAAVPAGLAAPDILFEVEAVAARP
jgi:hypothetical protein